MPDRRALARARARASSASARGHLRPHRGSALPDRALRWFRSPADNNQASIEGALVAGRRSLTTHAPLHQHGQHLRDRRATATPTSLTQHSDARRRLEVAPQDGHLRERRSRAYVTYLNDDARRQQQGLDSYPLHVTAGLRGLLTEKTSAVLTLGYVNGFYSDGAIDGRIPGEHLPRRWHSPLRLTQLSRVVARVPPRLRERGHPDVLLQRDASTRPTSSRSPGGSRSICRAGIVHRDYQGQFVDPTQMTPGTRTDNFFQVGATLDYFLRNWAYLGVGYSLLSDNTQPDSPDRRLPQAAGVCAPGRHVLDSPALCQLAVVRHSLARVVWRCSWRWRASHASSARPSSDERQLGPPEDRIGIDDTFDVRVYGETELSGTFRVATDGTVDYPLAGRLQVAGLRTGEIQQLLVSKLKDKYLKDPQVIVTIKDRNSQKISVLGPGREARPGRLLPEHDDRRRHRQRRRLHRHRRQELGEPASGGRRQDRDARLPGRRHQRRTLAQRDGSPR